MGDVGDVPSVPGNVEDVPSVAGYVSQLVGGVTLLVGDDPLPRPDAAEFNEYNSLSIQFSYVEKLCKVH